MLKKKGKSNYQEKIKKKKIETSFYTKFHIIACNKIENQKKN